MVRLLEGIVSLALLAALGYWAWLGLGAKSREEASVPPAFRTECEIAADTGQCGCRHVDTGKRVNVPYEECVKRSRSR